MAATKLLIGLALFPIFISILFGLFSLYNPTFHMKSPSSDQVELTPSNITEVLTEKGRLSHIGWARSNDMFKFTPSRIRTSTSIFSFYDRFRYKKWEAFVFFHKDFIIGTALYDLSYAGGYFLYYSNLTSSDMDIKSVVFGNPFVHPSITDDCRIPCEGKIEHDGFKYNQVRTGSSQFLKFVLNTTDLQVDMDLKLRSKDFDRIVTLNPISEDSSLFYYNMKTYGISAVGQIAINGIHYSDKDLLITYDSGRGAWPLRSGWKWFSANGRTKSGEIIGINIGHGFTHPKTSKHTEDTFFINGKLFKLPSMETRTIYDESKQVIEYQFSPYENENNKLKSTCKLKFTVLKHLDSGLNLLITQVVFSMTHGRVSGACIDDANNRYELDDVFGILEDKLSLW